jgi:two-component system, chemotaxis family, sensor kinase CheA
MTDDHDSRPDRARGLRDFLAESDEILETLSDTLRDLEAAFAAGRPHIGLIDRAFRAAHSLKGFASLLGFPEIAWLTHALEDLLSRLRLGGALDGAVLDLLHDTLDALLGTMKLLRSGSKPAPDAESLRERLARAAAAIEVPGPRAKAGIELPDGLLACLTEYEEKRLKASLVHGLRLSLVRVRPDPQSLKEQLQEIAQRIAEVGEVISTLPVMGAQDEGIAFDLLVASPRSLVDEDLPRGIVVSRRDLAPDASAGPQSWEAAGGGDETAGEPRADTGDGGLGDGSGPASLLRVPAARLDEILARAGALGVAISALEGPVAALREAHPRDRAVRDLDARVQVVASGLRLLQRGVIEARLVPLDREFRKAGRAVARAARETGKEIDLLILGASTEIDKSVMDGLAPPLMHLVANAVDHGIETTEERERLSKPRRGRLVLSAIRRGPSVLIDVSDDGRGIGPAAVQAAAVARGLWGADRDMTRDEAQEMIFRAGFSTASIVSVVSGRGVGLDVVRRALRALKGSISIRSVVGQGTTFTLTVPVSLALVPALIVRSSGQRFAIPLGSIEESLRLDSGRVRDSGKGPVYERPDGPLPLLSLDRWFGRVDENVGGAGTLGRYALVAAGSDGRFGLVVDGLVRRQEVMVQPVGRLLGDLPGVTGAADLGDAVPVLVLDPTTLVSGDHHATAVV